jgi:putative tricarboxylic transport membrane protein
MMQAAPELLFATVAGLIGGAAALFFFGWPLGKVMLRATRTDRRIVLPLAFTITLVGVFALRRSTFDVFVLLIAGVVGYFMIRYGYPPIAAGVALILGPGFEANLRLGLLLEDSNIVAFVARPWTAVILTACVALLAYGTWQTLRSDRRRLGTTDTTEAPAHDGSGR